jgi:hypothetical protein
MVRIDVPADRQEGFDLIGPDEKRSADPWVRRHYRPLVPTQEVHQTGNQVADRTPDHRMGHQYRRQRRTRTAHRSIGRAMCLPTQIQPAELLV